MLSIILQSFPWLTISKTNLIIKLKKSISFDFNLGKEYKKSVENEENSQVTNFIVKIVYVVFALVVIFFIARFFFGNDTIGSWFEKQGEYATHYWVYLQPDSQSTKNYRVRGDIDKVSLGEDGWGYYLRTAYWNNGGNSDFDDCQLTSEKGDYCETVEGQSYTVRLGEKVSK